MRHKKHLLEYPQRFRATAKYPAKSSRQKQEGGRRKINNRAEFVRVYTLGVGCIRWRNSAKIDPLESLSERKVKGGERAQAAKGC